MPLYEYQCEACNNRFERIQKVSDPPIATCPVCGKGPVKKLLSSPAIQFKGSGWYVTDYARKGDAGKSSGSSESSSSDDSSASSAKKVESKPEPAAKSSKD